jgi:uncharacterized membrane protein YhaH (DUF805 family)
MSVTACLFSFRGRLRRSDFWLFSALVFAAMVTSAGVAGELLGVDIANPMDPRAILIQLSAIALFMWPNLAVCAKRLHDRGQSGWWILISFLPVIGNVWMVVNLGVMRGDEGPNRYGPEPARPQLTLIPRQTALA